MKRTSIFLVAIATFITFSGFSCGTTPGSSENTNNLTSTEVYGTYSLSSNAREGTKVTFYVNQFNSNEVKKANEGDLVYFKVEISSIETSVNYVYSDDANLNELIPLEVYSFIMPKKDVMIQFSYVNNESFNIDVSVNHNDAASLKVLVSGLETNTAYTNQTINLEVQIKNIQYQFESLNLINGSLFSTSVLNNYELVTDIEGQKYHFTMPNNDVTLILNVKLKKEYETFDNCTITFWHTMGRSNQERLNFMIDEFNKKYPNIEVKHYPQGGYSDIENKILKAIPSEKEPTMAFCYPDHVANYGDRTVNLVPYVNSKEKILDKDGKETGEIVGLTEEEKADYIQGFWEEGSQYEREGFYSAPFSKATEVIFYNASFFKKHNLPLPTQWESDDPNDLTAMWNLCRKIKEIDSSITPLGYDSDENMYITLSAQYGIPYTSIKDGKGSFDFDNDQAKALVKRLKNYYDEGLFTTKGTSPDNTYTSTLFKNQKVMMSIGSTAGTAYNIPKQSNDEYEFDAQVAQIPQQNTERNYAISQGPSICFFKNSNISDAQVKASWLFYKFITSPENSAMYALLTGYEPIRNSAYETQQYKDHLAKLGTEEETLYTRVAILTQTNAVRNSYFASPAFKGTAIARQQCGGIIALTMFEDASKVDIDARINSIFEDALNECLKAAL